MLPPTRIVFIMGLASATFGNTTQTAVKLGLRAYAHELSGCLDAGSETHNEIGEAGEEEDRILCALDRVLSHFSCPLVRCIVMHSSRSSNHTARVSSATSIRTANPGSLYPGLTFVWVADKFFDAGRARSARSSCWLVNWASNLDNFERQVLCQLMVQREAGLHMVSSKT